MGTRRKLPSLSFGLAATVVVACQTQAPKPAARAEAKPTVPVTEPGPMCGGGKDCPHAEDGAAAQGAAAVVPAKDGAERQEGLYGAPFDVAAGQPLSALLGKAAGPVTASGEVAAVCRKRGCWLTLRDGEAEARVLMQGHAFSVPVDSQGRRAVVHGALAEREFSLAQAKHLEEDRGGDPAAITAPRREYVIRATGVQFVPAS